jgi:hypothetical protein
VRAMFLLLLILALGFVLLPRFLDWILRDHHH